MDFIGLVHHLDIAGSLLGRLSRTMMMEPPLSRGWVV